MIACRAVQADASCQEHVSDTEKTMDFSFAVRTASREHPASCAPVFRMGLFACFAYGILMAWARGLESAQAEAYRAGRLVSGEWNGEWSQRLTLLQSSLHLGVLPSA